MSPKAIEFFKFLHLFLSLLQNYLFVAPSVEIKFCCQSCDVIFPAKNRTIVWNTKFKHPANFELKQIKTES